MGRSDPRLAGGTTVRSGGSTGSAKTEASSYGTRRSAAGLAFIMGFGGKGRLRPSPDLCTRCKRPIRKGNFSEHFMEGHRVLACVLYLLPLFACRGLGHRSGPDQSLVLDGTLHPGRPTLTHRCRRGRARDHSLNNHSKP